VITANCRVDSFEVGSLKKSQKYFRVKKPSRDPPLQPRPRQKSSTNSVERWMQV